MQGRVNLAGALAVIGAIGVLVGLSLDWFEPEISAWTAFEVIDLLLAAIALGVVAGALSRTFGRPRPEDGARWLPIAALAALALVVASLANHPPAAIDRSLEVGAWISLGGAVLLVIAAILTTTELSVVVTMRPRRRRPVVGGNPGADDPEWGAMSPDPGWDLPADEPLEDVPPEEPATDESPLETDPDQLDEAIDELTEPIDEGLMPAEGEDVDDEPPPESETRRLP